MSSEDSNDDPLLVPKKQKLYIQKFNKAWEVDPLLKADPWLSELKKYAVTKKYQESLRSVSKTTISQNLKIVLLMK